MTQHKTIEEITNRVICGDALAVLKTLPDDCCSMCVTSPPYWSLRDYQVDGMIGLEPTLDEFIAKLVEVFREVRRVLHPSGVCWVNIGMSYAGSGKGRNADGSRTDFSGLSGKSKGVTEGIVLPTKNVNGFKPKDLIPQPWLLGLALLQDGWWLRSEIIWAKPNPMPGSQQDRCTTAHETILMLTKSQRYAFYMDQVREPAKDWGTRDRSNFKNGTTDPLLKHHGFTNGNQADTGRALRSVWTMATEPMGWMICSGCSTVYPPEEYRRLPTSQKTRTYEGDGQGVPSGWATGSKARENGTDELEGGFTGIEKICRTCKATDKWVSHYASFPKELVRKAILASTPNKGGVCSKCGMPWMADIDRNFHGIPNQSEGKKQRIRCNTVTDGTDNVTLGRTNQVDRTITGYSPGCTCNAPSRPALVLDCFAGSCTTGLVARNLGRDYCLIELNPHYVTLGERRIALETAQMRM